MSTRILSDESLPDSESNPATSHEELQSNPATNNCDEDKVPRTRYIALVKQLKESLQVYMLAGSEHFEVGRYLSEYRRSRFPERRSLMDKGSFTCFSRLPGELRRHIWLHALPSPRVLQLIYYEEYDELKDPTYGYTLYIKLEDNQYQCRVPTQLRLVCKESYELFAEHFGYITLSKTPDESFVNLGGSKLSWATHLPVNRIWCYHFINFKADTLMVHDFEGLRFMLSEFGLQLNLSSLKKLAVTGLESNPQSIGSPFMWRLIEQICPLLECLNVVIDCDSPMEAGQATVYNLSDYADRLSEAEKKVVVRKSADLYAGIARTDHSKALNCRQGFSHTVQASYAKRVELDISRVCYFGRPEEVSHKMYLLEIHIREDVRVFYLKDDIITLKLTDRTVLD